MITDLTPYRKHVDQFDLTEEQKLELVNALWAIVDSIFDQHLGINQVPLKPESESAVQRRKEWEDMKARRLEKAAKKPKKKQPSKKVAVSSA
jgi:hypothetical protein